MTWQTDIVLMVRYIVDDVDAPQDYTDARLQTTVAIAAHMVATEIDWDKTYVIDINTPSIAPDPTDETRDIAFINLTALKAACIIARAEYKQKAASAGVTVKDAQASVTIGAGQAAAFQIRANDVCGQYQQAKLEYQAGNSRAGEAILGPYTYANLCPQEGNF